MDYFLHELLHMSLFLSESWNSQILDNHYFAENKKSELYKKASAISEQMFELYHLIGNQHLTT